jgi:hypothetical protein
LASTGSSDTKNSRRTIFSSASASNPRRSA